MNSINYKFVIDERKQKLCDWVRRFFVIMILCFVESFLNGVLHVIFCYVSLPSSDAAKQSGLLFFCDPFVLTVLFVECVYIGLLATPVALLFFWHKSVKKVFLILTAVCVPLTIIISPLGVVITVSAVGCGAMWTSFMVFVFLRDMRDKRTWQTIKY